MSRQVKLRGSTVAASLSRLQRHVSDADRERLEGTLRLLGEAQELRLDRALHALFPDRDVQDQLQNFRLFRSRLAAAAEETGIALRLEVDTRKRSTPNKRLCWFEGEDVADAEVGRLVLAQSPQSSVTPLDALELAEDGRRVLRFFVMWSLKPEPKRLGNDLLSRLAVQFDTSAKFKFERWSANDDIDVGEDWHEAIQRAIKSAHFGLLFIGPEFLGSPYIRKHELPKFIMADSMEDDRQRIAIPVALKQFLLDGTKTNLQGLECKQIFFRETDQGKLRAFSEENHRQDKDNFVMALYQRILRRFEKLPGAPLLQGRRTIQDPSGKQDSPVTGRESLSLAEEMFDHSVKPSGESVIVAPEGMPGDLDQPDTLAAESMKTQRIAALDYLNEWLNGADEPPYCALLGDVGVGKTTTCRAWATQLTEIRQGGDTKTPLAIYFDLRWLGGETSNSIPNRLEDYLDILIRRTWQGGTLHSPLTAQDVLDRVQRQGALIIYDGLDEVLVHKTETEGQTFIRELLRILPPLVAHSKLGSADRPGRVLLTCRTHYFRTLRNQTAFLLGEHREALRKHYRAFVLLPFTDAQIEQYLSEVTTPEEVPRYMELIAGVYNLSELAKRPLLLKLISEQFPRLEERRLRGESVNGAVLYENFIASWLERDQGKHRILPAHKQLLMERLAAWLWEQGRRTLPVTELEQWLAEFLDQAGTIKLHYLQSSLELLKEDLRTATFLVREDSEDFRFAHTSLQEFFLAAHLQRALLEGQWDTWARITPNDEVHRFLGQRLQVAKEDIRSRALEGLRHLRDRPLGVASANAFRYALSALAQGYPTPSAAGFQLQGADLRDLNVSPVKGLERINLEGSSFAGTRLDRARFSGVNLEHADFSAATLNWAEFHSARLVAASFVEAQLTGTVFRYCNSSQANFRDARLYRAQWHHCQLGGAQHVLRAPPEAFFSACEGLECPTPSGDNIGPAIFSGHRLGINVCAFSPDGSRVVSGSRDGVLKIWDARSGECLQTLSGHGSSVQSVAYACDGNRVVSGSDDATLKVWDARSGECLQTLSGHSREVSSVAYAPDCSRVASGSDDCTLKIWDAHSGECLQTLFGKNNSGVRSVAYAPDGCRVAAGSHDGTLKIWDALSGECLQTMHGHSRTLRSLAYAPDSNRVASGGDDLMLTIWDARSGECLQTLSGHSSWVLSVAYAPDGTRVASGSADLTLKIWDARSGECLQTLSGHSSPVRSVAYTPDGGRIVSGSDDGTLKIWDARSGECLQTLSRHSCPVCVAYAPNGSHVVSGSNDGMLTIWDARSGECFQPLFGHMGGVRSVAYAPGGSHVVSGSDDGTLKIWDARSGECLQTLSGHRGAVFGVAYAPDGIRVASGSRDQTVKIWDVRTWQCLQTLSGHRGMVRSVAYASDGSHVVSGSDDGMLRIWDARTGKCLQTLSGHMGGVFSVAYAPEGSCVASGSRDHTLKIWDVRTGKCLQTLSGHGSVLSVAYAPDGRRAAAALSDGTLKIWDTQSGECLQSILKPESAVTSVAFSRTGDHVVASTAAGGIHVWSLDEQNKETLRIIVFNSDSWANWRPGRSEAPTWTGDAWRWLGWQIRDRETGALERYPIETFAAQEVPGGKL
jgi:WD40 repeat protein